MFLLANLQRLLSIEVDIESGSHIVVGTINRCILAGRTRKKYPHQQKQQGTTEYIS